jgi:hypothetical protein
MRHTALLALTLILSLPLSSSARDDTVPAGSLPLPPVLPDDARWIVQRYDREQTMSLWRSAELHLTTMKTLEWQFPANPHEYRAWLADAKWCHDVWYTVDDIVMYHRANSTLCEEKCLHLRRLIGDEAYFLGRLPPPWPVWWFRTMD